MIPSLKKILEKQKFKPQRNCYNPRFGKTKIYLFKYIFDKIEENSVVNLPDKFNKINSITEKKELKKTNKIDRIKVSFDLFVKVGKKVSEIAF